MKVLLTGSAGQLGQALIASKPKAIELIATSRKGGERMQALDLADSEACRKAVLLYRPDWVINAGAYTAVDRAESQPDLAYLVNAGAPKAFAQALLETGGRLLQLSTDFVFDGSQGNPYCPEDERRPMGVYGATKATGEEVVDQFLGDVHRFSILRTSWVYGPVGKNFLLTMLRLMRDRDHIGVVADQVGCPSATKGLSNACWAVLQSGATGFYHWSDAGAASWYDFAVAIAELGREAGILDKPVEIKPLITSDYPTPAQRPSYSLLDCSNTRKILGLCPRHWREALQQVMSDVVA